MRIAIIGAGAVGSVLGSLLWRAGEDVVLVGRAAHVAAIRSAGHAACGRAPHRNRGGSRRSRSGPDLALRFAIARRSNLLLAGHARMVLGCTASWLDRSDAMFHR